MSQYVRERLASSVRGEREESVAIRLSMFTTATSGTAKFGDINPRRNNHPQQREKRRPRGRRRRRWEQMEKENCTTQDTHEISKSWGSLGDNPSTMATNRPTFRWIYFHLFFFKHCYFFLKTYLFVLLFFFSRIKDQKFWLIKKC